MSYEQAINKALAWSQQQGYTCFIYQAGKGFEVQGYQDHREEYAFTRRLRNSSGQPVWSVCKKG